MEEEFFKNSVLNDLMTSNGKGQIHTFQIVHDLMTSNGKGQIHTFQLVGTDSLTIQWQLGS